MGKGSKERRLPIGRNAVAWIEHWLDLRGLFGTDDDALFLSKLGKRISARNVQKRFAEWGIKQGLNSHVHPHKLRHSLPPICWSRAAICAACRSCWGMLTSPPPKSIPILIFNTLPRCTMPRIRALNGEIMRFYRPLGQISALTFDPTIPFTITAR